MQRGFTLIELLVVIAIIGILSSVVLSSLNAARQKSCIKSGDTSETCKSLTKDLTYEEKQEIKNDVKTVEEPDPVQNYDSCERYAEYRLERLPARCLNYWQNKI